MTLNTWINNELITLDVDETWREVFAHWDALVETDVAVRIANATTEILRSVAEADNA